MGIFSFIFGGGKACLSVGLSDVQERQIRENIKKSDDRGLDYKTSKVVEGLKDEHQKHREKASDKFEESIADFKHLKLHDANKKIEESMGNEIDAARVLAQAHRIENEAQRRIQELGQDRSIAPPVPRMIWPERPQTIRQWPDMPQIRDIPFNPPGAPSTGWC